MRRACDCTDTKNIWITVLNKSNLIYIDLEFEYLPITSHLTKIQIMKYDNEIIHHPWKEVTCYPVFSTFKRTAKSSSAGPTGSPPAPPRRDSSRKNSRLERWTKDIDAESAVELKVRKPKPENEKKVKSTTSLKSATKTQYTGKKDNDKSVKVLPINSVSVKGKPLVRSSTSSTNFSESTLPKRTKSLSTPAKNVPISRNVQKTVSKEKMTKSSLVKTNSGKRQSKKIETVKTSVTKTTPKSEKTNRNNEKQNQFGEEFFQQLLLTDGDQEKTSKTNPCKAKAKTEVVKRKVNNIDVYLTSKKPVSQSKFKSYDRYHSEYQPPGAPEWDQFGDDCADYLKGRSASEPPSRSPSSRRIKGFQAPVKLIESVTGIRRCRRSKSAEEPMERAKNAAVDYEYQTYVRDLRHSSKKSERFKELHSFYCSLERLGELEKTAEKAGNRARTRAGDLVDYDKWKTLRVKERAEDEIKSIRAKLENIQKLKDVLYKTKDPGEIRWKRSLDRGLRNRETSVDDLKRKFLAIGSDLYCKPEVNVYRPLWRGTSVQDVANSLKHVTSSQRGRPMSEDRGTKPCTPSTPRRPTSKSPSDIGCRIWSSLSTEQLNRLKTRLNEVYSAMSELDGGGERRPRALHRGKRDIDYEIHVSGTANEWETDSSLYVRSSSAGPSGGRVAGRGCGPRKADSIGSVCMSEKEKKRISKNISDEVLEKKHEKRRGDNLVKPKETLGAIASARNEKRVSENVSPRTCYSIDVSEEESAADGGEKNYLLVLADREDRKRTVSDWAANVSESGSSASTVVHVTAGTKPGLHSSQSFSSMAGLLGERRWTGTTAAATAAEVVSRPVSSSRPRLSVRNLCRKFESFDDLRFLQQQRRRRQQQRWRPLEPNTAKRYKSDPELRGDAIVRRYECGDVRGLKSRYERPGSPVPGCPLRPDNRHMPRINVISKTARLLRDDESARGAVGRIADAFENANRRAFPVDQLCVSAPDLRETGKTIPFLECDWTAHRYPERPPTPLSAARPRARPKSASPVRYSRKSDHYRYHHHHHHRLCSILKNATKHDGFLCQPYNPDAHKPKYRWTPTWNGVWTQQPAVPPKPSSIVTFKGAPPV